MEFQLETPKTIVTRAAETTEFSNVVIERILDEPINAKVIVWVRGLPHPVELASLSNENYNNPPWDDALVVQEITSFLNTL